MKKYIGIFSVSYLLVILFAVSVFGESGFTSDSYTFSGWVQVGTPACVDVGWYNRSSITCWTDQNGSGCTSVPSRTVSFNSSTGITVSPNPVVVPGLVTTQLHVCAPLWTEGFYYGSVYSDPSPALDGDANNSFSLQINRFSPSVKFSPVSGSTIDFGSVIVGNTLASSIYICNYYPYSVTITGATVDNGNFSVISGVNTVLSPMTQNGPSCNSVYLGFSPQATGVVNGNAQITTTIGNSVFAIAGTGRLVGITTSSTGYGAITPSFSVGLNGSASVIMTPSTGYTLDFVKDNGVVVAATVGPSGTYTYSLNNITIDHSLVATFKSLKTVTASVSGTGGTIFPETATVGYYGNDSTPPVVVMMPSTGYTLNSLTDNGTVVTATVGPSGTYTYSLNNITTNHSLIATFKPVYTYAASVTGSGGTVIPTTSTTMYGVYSQIFTLTPQNGYTLDKLIDNGVDVTSTAILTQNNTFMYGIYDLNKDHVIQASYIVGTPSVTPVPALGPWSMLMGAAGLGMLARCQKRAKKSVISRLL